MKKVLVIGEPLILFSSTECANLENAISFNKHVVGAELNVAVGLTRLGYHVEYVSKLSTDAFGKSVLNFLSKENIGMKYISFDENHNTGVQVKEKVKKGDPEVIYYRKILQLVKSQKEDVKNIAFEEFDLFHITGIPLAISTTAREAILYIVEQAKKHNKIVTFDPNIRLSMWNDKEYMKAIIHHVATNADYFIPGIHECEILIGEKEIDKIREKYFEMGINNIVIKDGDRGSYYLSKEKTVFESCFKVSEVKDTVGAGDGYSVGIVSSILENLEHNKMLERANAIGSIQVASESDNNDLPNRESLEKYIKEGVKK